MDPRGPYPKLLDHWYDQRRDATRYAGPWPIVAHPPCGHWSSLRHFAKKDDGHLALVALEQVRQWGGVLEHPATSLLWERVKWTLEVDQVDWGHVARKRTRLLVVGPLYLPPRPPPGTPTHWCAGSHAPGSDSRVPPGIRIASAEQRRRTPTAFAEWLIAIAARCAR